MKQMLHLRILSLFLLFTVLFLNNKADAQWQNTYSHEFFHTGDVYWIDSATAVVGAAIVSDYGASYQFVNGYLPISRNLFLYISPEAYMYFNDSGNLVSSTAYATAMDTGTNTIWVAFGVYINPDCWLHVMQRVNGKVEARITHNRGASWHDTEIPQLNWQWGGISYVFSEKFTLRTVDSSIWMYSALHWDTLYRSVDLGKSWEKIVLPSWLNPYDYEMMAFSSEKEGLMICINDNNLAKTTDGGKTWSVEAVGKPAKKNWSLTYAKASRQKEGFYALYGPDGCHFSTSQGQWWTVMDTLKHDNISFYNAEAGFSFNHEIGQSNPTLRTFSNNLATSLPAEPSSLLSIYPNPTNGLLFTKMSDPTAALIFDCLGKEVLRFESFNQDAPLNIRALAPGTYLLVLPLTGQRTPIIKY